MVRSGWRAKTEENRNVLTNDIKYVLKPLEPPYGELRGKDLPLQATRILLLTEGPYTSAFKDGPGMNFGYSAVAFEYKWICLSFLMQEGDFVFCIVYLAFSLQGLFQSPIFYSFHLLDLVVSTSLLFLVNSVYFIESLSPASKCDLECNAERQPAADDGHARRHHYLHLLCCRFCLPL